MTDAKYRSILVYAAVRDVRMLAQGFYAAEVDGLRAHPRVRDVQVTNRMSDVVNGDYDGLLSFFYSHSALACLIARSRGRPAVVTGGGEQVFPALAGNKLRWLARVTAFQLTVLFATQILATSTSDLVQMQRVAWWGKRKIRLSYHGAVAVEQRVNAPFVERPAGSFITICGMDTVENVERKGIFKAIDILAAAAKECTSSCLCIIGRTTCRDIVENYAERLGVKDRLNFAGYVEEHQKLSLLREHKYYIQLSIYEGFGIGALEAVAQGCQVIHSNVGGLLDTVANFGVVLQRDFAHEFRLNDLVPYDPDPAALTHHLARFSPAARSETIFNELFKQQ